MTKRALFQTTHLSNVATTLALTMFTALTAFTLGSPAHAGRVSCGDCEKTLPLNGAGTRMSITPPLGAESSAAPKRRLSLAKGAKGAKQQRLRAEHASTARPAVNVTVAKP